MTTKVGLWLRVEIAQNLEILVWTTRIPMVCRLLLIPGNYSLKSNLFGLWATDSSCGHMTPSCFPWMDVAWRNFPNIRLGTVIWPSNLVCAQTRIHLWSPTHLESFWNDSGPVPLWVNSSVYNVSNLCKNSISENEETQVARADHRLNRIDGLLVKNF